MLYIHPSFDPPPFSPPSRSYRSIVGSLTQVITRICNPSTFTPSTLSASLSPDSHSVSAVAQSFVAFPKIQPLPPPLVETSTTEIQSLITPCSLLARVRDREQRIELASLPPILEQRRLTPKPNSTHQNYHPQPKRPLRACARARQKRQPSHRTRHSRAEKHTSESEQVIKVDKRQGEPIDRWVRGRVWLYLLLRPTSGGGRQLLPGG